MHESALARKLLSMVIERAEAEGARRVLSVHGTVAETESLSVEALSFHFAAHGRGSIAEGARLVLSLRTVQARCRRCGTTYLPEHHVTLCPNCNGSLAELLGQTGTFIDAIDVE